MLISQSLINDFFKPDLCREYVRLKYLEGNRTDSSDLMKRGQYFEHHLIGGTRDGNIPELPTLKNGDKAKATKDLDTLIESAKGIMKVLEIEIIESQPEWIFENTVAHPDLLATMKGEKCIIDIKYTETKSDDKWNGWGAPESKENLQAVHYPWIYQKLHGEWLPFYYLIFGKSGWVKLVRCKLHHSRVDSHERILGMLVEEIGKQVWKGSEDYNTCQSCDFKAICEKKTSIPNTVLVDLE